MGFECGIECTTRETAATGSRGEPAYPRKRNLCIQTRIHKRKIFHGKKRDERAQLQEYILWVGERKSFCQSLTSWVLAKYHYVLFSW